MINEITMSGKFINLYELTEQNMVLAVIKNNDEYFYIFWKKGAYTNLKAMIHKHIIVVGQLHNIMIKLPNQKTKKSRTGISVRRMELYDI